MHTNKYTKSFQSNQFDQSINRNKPNNHKHNTHERRELSYTSANNKFAISQRNKIYDREREENDVVRFKILVSHCLKKINPRQCGIDVSR